MTYDKINSHKKDRTSLEDIFLEKQQGRGETHSFKGEEEALSIRHLSYLVELVLVLKQEPLSITVPLKLYILWNCSDNHSPPLISISIINSSWPLRCSANLNY